MRGSGWTLAGYGSQQVLRLASNLVLTRLLFPEAFGLMALANIFMTGLQMFSDIGIKPSIIQSKRGQDTTFLNTAWTLGVIRGGVLWLFACAISYPLSLLYDSPIMFPLLCMIGSTAAIRGFQTTGYATSNRKLHLGRLTMVELLSQAIGIAATIVWALVSPTVWSIAAGGIISSISSVYLGHRVLNTHRHKFELEKTARVELVRFGRWILLSSAITFLAQSGDRLFLPKLLDITSLSFYAIAMSLAQIPTQFFGQIATRVLFPVYSEMANKGGKERVGKAITRFAAISSYVYIVPIIMVFVAEFVIDFLYDARYSQAGGVLSLLAISSFIRMMRWSQDGLLLAVGNSRSHMMVNIARISTWLPAATILASRYGLQGFCVGIILGDAVALVTQRLLVARNIGGYAIRTDRILLTILLFTIAAKSLLLI